MRKIAAAVIGIMLVSAAPIGSYYILQSVCSLQDHVSDGGAYKKPETPKLGEKNSRDQNQQAEPSATFDLRVAEPDKIEGKYSANKGDRKENNWGKNFLCDIKISEFAIAILTYFLVLFTAMLWRSTDKLWIVTRDTALAAQKQAAISISIENPIPLVGALNLVQYEQIPGEVSTLDPVPPGPIPESCRILFMIENKGRTVLRMTELCVEKFIGQLLPSLPTYKSVVPWGMYLEKGPIWIRFQDEQAVITPSEVSAINGIYPEGAFWVYGYITYLNLLDEKLQYKFLWRWDLKRGFIPENRTGYT
jgi:hypothetical protein